MTLKIEKMIKNTLNDPESFNPEPYQNKDIANQFVFAIEGLPYEDSLFPQAIVCRIVPKILWEKERYFFTEEIDLQFILGDDCEDINGTGLWILPNFPKDHLKCAEELVKLGFIWNKELQEFVNDEPSDDVEPWDSSDFIVINK